MIALYVIAAIVALEIIIPIISIGIPIVWEKVKKKNEQRRLC